MSDVVKRLDGSWCMPSGMQLVGRPRRHFVLAGDPAPSPKRGTAHFGRCLLWPNGWMDHSRFHLVRTEYRLHGGRSRPRPHCVRWGPTPHKKGLASPSSHVYCGQTVAHLNNCWVLNSLWNKELNQVASASAPCSHAHNFSKMGFV